MNLIVDVVCRWVGLGKYYGVILILEGLIDFILEIESLIVDLNDFLVI